MLLFAVFLGFAVPLILHIYSLKNQLANSQELEAINNAWENLGRLRTLIVDGEIDGN